MCLGDELLAEEPDRLLVVRDGEVPRWEARGRARWDEDGAGVEAVTGFVTGRGEGGLCDGVVSRCSTEGEGDHRAVGRGDVSGREDEWARSRAANSNADLSGSSAGESKSRDEGGEHYEFFFTSLPGISGDGM